MRDELDMPRVEALNRHWKLNPPLVVSARLAAQAQGVDFGATAPSRSRATPDASVDSDPTSMLTELGAVERPYIRPAKGLPVG